VGAPVTWRGPPPEGDAIDPLGCGAEIRRLFSLLPGRDPSGPPETVISAMVSGARVPDPSLLLCVCVLDAQCLWLAAPAEAGTAGPR